MSSLLDFVTFRKKNKAALLCLGYYTCDMVKHARAHTHTQFFKTRFLYIALAVLELTIDQAVLKLTRIHLLLPPKRWD